MVIADTLAGGGGDSTLGNLTAPIDYDIGKHSKDTFLSSRFTSILQEHIQILTVISRAVTALVLYGDPRHAPYQPYNQGYETFNVTGVCFTGSYIYIV